MNKSKHYEAYFEFLAEPFFRLTCKNRLAIPQINPL